MKGKSTPTIAEPTQLVPSPARARRLSQPPPIPMEKMIDSMKTRFRDSWEEDRLKQAFYYSAANGLLVILVAAGIALWFVFQEFVEPLFWAVLCGALLHPIKTRWVKSTDAWLVKISNRSIPLVLGIFILIFSIPGMLFRFFTKTKSRAILVGNLLAINIVIEFLGWSVIIDVFITASKFIYMTTTLIVETLIFSGSTVSAFTAHINTYIVVTVIFSYFGLIFYEINHHVNTTLSLITKWIIWIFIAAIAYPYIVYNWITVAAFTGILICTFLGLKQKIRAHQKERSHEKLPIEKKTNLSTEVITILFIFSIMYIANILQVVVFLLGISCFYWIALGIKITVVQIFTYKTFSEHLAPPPLRFIWDCFEKGDQILLQWIRKQLNMIYSVLIILILVLGAIGIVLFFSVHLYRENSQLAEDIWEQRHKIFPNIHDNKFGKIFNQTRDLDDLYLNARTLALTHGTDWVQQKISDISGTDVNILDLQAKITELWDDTSGALDNMEWRVPTQIVQDLIRSGDAATFWKAYGSNVSMVAETLWSQVLLNIRLIWWFVMKGWGFFNFLFSLLLFLTALFYLIASSQSNTYKPLSWILFFFPEESLRETASILINDSVNQVFKTAFKLAIFHGLWCWCTFSMFGCHLIYLPTLLAALMAVLPLLPTYFDSLPGVLELWLVWNRPISAISLFALHFTASWFIDPMVYSEIESSHHYITGLSVVGGLYFFGIQGVLIGPMLVCALLVIRNITMVMANSEEIKKKNK